MRSQHLVLLLRAERKAKKLRSHLLAKEIGYSENMISLWESGRVIPSVDALIIWANSLGYKIIMEKS